MKPIDSRKVIDSTTGRPVSFCRCSGHGCDRCRGYGWERIPPDIRREILNPPKVKAKP